MLNPHPHSALEYWYFKVNAANGVALLVDWITRRNSQEMLLRVSIHTPPRHEVLTENIAEVALNETCTNGQIGDIAWDLQIDTHSQWIAPDIFPAKLVRMSDLVVVSAPHAQFTGWIRCGNTQYELTKSKGLVSHYWGRQLASEWWWISANQMEPSGVAVECSLIRSHLWGSPLQMPFAYLYLHDGTQSKLLMSPPARTKVSGTPEQFEIRFQPLHGAPIILRGNGQHYNSLGDNIINTLIGNLEVYRSGTLIGQAVGTAGLERRFPSTEIVNR